MTPHERTVTVTGTVREQFGHEPWGDPAAPYGHGPTLIVERSGDNVRLGISSGQGWEWVRLTPDAARDVIVSIEEALHPVPLVDPAFVAEAIP